MSSINFALCTNSKVYAVGYAFFVSLMQNTCFALVDANLSKAARPLIACVCYPAFLVHVFYLLILFTIMRITALSQPQHFADLEGVKFDSDDVSLFEGLGPEVGFPVVLLQTIFVGDLHRWAREHLDVRL